MFPFLAIAAQFILPELIKAITDKNKVSNADQISSLIDNTVRSVTKADTPADAEKAIRGDPAVADQLKVAVAQIALEAQKIDAADAQAFDAAANTDSADARRTLLNLLHEPESRLVSMTPSIISFIVIVGFISLVTALIFGKQYFPSDPPLLQVINICIGAVAAGFATVLNFWLGSSLGSRRKDNSIALSTTVDNVKSLTQPSLSGGTASSDASEKRTGPSPLPTGPKPLPASLAAVGRSTDAATRNVRSSVPQGSDGIPASIRYNNPGAQWPSAEAARFGQIGYGAIAGRNLIARFPSPVNGAAANFDLLDRRYVGKSIGEAGRIWTGNNGFGVPNYSSDLLLSQEMLDDQDQAIALLKAIAKREAGKESPLTEEQWRYAFQMYKARSADAFLASFGRTPTTIVAPVRPDGAANESLEVLIAHALEKNNMLVSKGADEVNVVYIEGMNADGSPNNDAPNSFNDLRCVIDFEPDGTPRMLGKWQATTEPGYFYDRDHPINPKGAARIKFGQYVAWEVGLHRERQEALVQRKNVTVCRDLNRDMQRVGDTEYTGDGFGINQHGGYDQPADDIGKASAGCLVGRLTSGHEAFMKIVKNDPRYKQDPQFVFATAILPAAAILDTTAI